MVSVYLIYSFIISAMRGDNNTGVLILVSFILLLILTIFLSIYKRYKTISILNVVISLSISSLFLIEVEVAKYIMKMYPVLIFFLVLFGVNFLLFKISFESRKTSCQ